jgi:Flp pilus assembly protein TadG
MIDVRSIFDFRRQKSGATAVEFAIIMPLFMLLLFGIVGYGLIIGVGHSLQQAAQEAARAAVAGLNDTERDSLARRRVETILGGTQLMSTDGLTIETGSSRDDPALWTVTLSYNLKATGLGSLGRAFLVTPDTLKRTASYRNGGY